MTATTTFDSPLELRQTAAVHAHRYSNTLQAEWTKIRSLRSTWYTVGGAALLSIAMSALICLATVTQWDQLTSTERAQFDPTSQTLVGVLFATVIFGSLAVRAITSEYSTGMIRITFSALPGRRSVLAAKAAILAAVAFPVALAANVVGFIAGTQILAGKVDPPSLSDPDVLRAIVFGALAVSLVSVFGLGLGGIIRRTAGATTAVSMAIIGTQIFGMLLPEAIRQFLPGMAIQGMVGVEDAAGVLTPIASLGVLAAYAAAAIGVAATLIARRDA